MSRPVKNIVMAWVIVPGLLLLGGPAAVTEKDYSSLKIAPPPGGGMYIGQNEWDRGNDIKTFEAAIGRKVAMKYDEEIFWKLDRNRSVGVRPEFNLAAAERAWQEGQVILVQSIAGSPFVSETTAPTGFTFDKLLKGQYDKDLKRLAAQYRQFGKPMFFQAYREPNGASSAFFGGFGPNGDKTINWAVANKRGLAEFDPSKFPNAHLYADLGDPNVCDGVERLVAGQRYYYDFFVRRKGLNFLTFDTMGWVVVPWEHEVQARFRSPYGRRLGESCFKFENIYPGDKYVDWVSLNLYMVDENPAINIPIEEYLWALRTVVARVRKVAPNKPVLITELGFAEPKKRDSSRAAKMLTKGFNEFIAKYPEINGFMMWSDLGIDAYLIRPNTRQGKAFKAVIDANPSKFHSCIYFSDGSKMPNC